MKKKSRFPTSVCTLQILCFSKPKCTACFFFFLLLLLFVIFCSSLCPSYLPFFVSASSDRGGLDNVREELFLQPLAQPGLFVAHLEITIASTAPITGNHFDVFPKDVGKLLTHLPICRFSATLTKGRWKHERWGPAPMVVYPNGALLTASTLNADVDPTTARKAWAHVANAAGALTSSFLNNLENFDFTQRIDERDDRQTEEEDEEETCKTFVASAPLETFCTENLTPWQKLLPCKTEAGLATLFRPLALAASPFRSVGMTAARRKDGGLIFRAVLSAVLTTPSAADEPPNDEALVLEKLFETQHLSRCHLFDESHVFLRLTHPMQIQSSGALLSTYRVEDGHEASYVHRFYPEGIGSVKGSWAKVLNETLGASDKLALVQVDRFEQSSMFTSKLEYVQSSLLFQFTNRSDRHAQILRYFDSIPFFAKPLVHSFRAEWRSIDDETGSSVVRLYAGEAFRELGVRWTPTDGKTLPTHFSFEAVLEKRYRLTLRLELVKQFVHTDRLGFSFERGQHIACGTLFHRPLPNLSASGKWNETNGDKREETFLWRRWVSKWRMQRASSDLGLSKEKEETISAPSCSSPHEADVFSDSWLLKFTLPNVFLVPYSDWTMPFNVVAISGTLVTFLFGSMFRLTTTVLPPFGSLA